MMAILCPETTPWDKIAGWIRVRKVKWNFDAGSGCLGRSGFGGHLHSLCDDGIRTIALNLPINQDLDQFDLSNAHISWLEDKWENAEDI